MVNNVLSKNPEQEVSKIKLAIDVLKKDDERKMIITDYQFISVFLGQYDYSVTRFCMIFKKTRLKIINILIIGKISSLAR